MLRPLFSMTNTRVDHAVEHIYQQVNHDNQNGDQQHTALYDRIVAALQCVDKPAAESRSGEDGFRQDGTTEQRAHLQTNDGHHRQQCVTQGVDHDHPHTADALGARGTDVVFTQHFQHGRTGHTHDNCQRNGTEYQGRKNHVHHRVFEVTWLAPNQRVDQHKAGQRHAVIEEYGIAYSPRYGREIKLHRDQHHQHDAPPEYRHRSEEHTS